MLKYKLTTQPTIIPNGAKTSPMKPMVKSTFAVLVGSTTARAAARAAVADTSGFDIIQIAQDSFKK